MESRLKFQLRNTLYGRVRIHSLLRKSGTPLSLTFKLFRTISDESSYALVDVYHHLDSIKLTGSSFPSRNPTESKLAVSLDTSTSSSFTAP